MSSILFSALLIGLDNSGKTCFIHNIKNNMYSIEKEIVPTAGFELHTIAAPSSGKNILIYDCSGQGKHRKLWSMLIKEVDAIIYMIDSTDVNRLKIIRETIEDFVRIKEIQIKNMPILFLINKIDHQDSLDRDYLKETLKLDNIKGLAKKFTIKETSSFTGSGVLESIEWLTSSVMNKLSIKK